MDWIGEVRFALPVCSPRHPAMSSLPPQGASCSAPLVMATCKGGREGAPTGRKATPLPKGAGGSRSCICFSGGGQWKGVATASAKRGGGHTFTHPNTLSTTVGHFHYYEKRLDDQTNSVYCWYQNTSIYGLNLEIGPHPKRHVLIQLDDGNMIRALGQPVSVLPCHCV